MLQDKVKPEMDISNQMERELSFQQDNAKPHKGQAVMDFLANWGYEVLDWPPQSPDLFPIENIWNIKKMRLKALRPRPRTKATMRNAMMDIWDNLLKLQQFVFWMIQLLCLCCIPGAFPETNIVHPDPPANLRSILGPYWNISGGTRRTGARLTPKERKT